MQYLNIRSIVKRAANNGISNIGFRGNPHNIIEILIRKCCVGIQTK